VLGVCANYKDILLLLPSLSAQSSGELNLANVTSQHAEVCSAVIAAHSSSVVGKSFRLRHLRHKSVLPFPRRVHASAGTA